MNELIEMIVGANASGGGNNIRDGKYRFIVKKLMFEKTQDGPAFIAELYVKSSVATEQGVEPNPAGAGVSVVQKLTKFKSAPGNTKAFFLAFFGPAAETLAPADFNKEIAEATNKDASKGPVNIARGFEIDGETYRKAKRSNEREILTLIKWAHVKPDEATIAANRKILDGGT